MRRRVQGLGVRVTNVRERAGRAHLLVDIGGLYFCGKIDIRLISGLPKVGFYAPLRAYVTDFASHYPKLIVKSTHF